MDQIQKRVLLWGLARSLSTVFLKSMSQLGDDVQIITEPYVAAIQLGPERKAPPEQTSSDMSKNLAGYMETVSGSQFELAIDDEHCTYQWAKELLEADYPRKDIVFCKDIAFALDNKYDMLPVRGGWRHTFIIRHPHKVFPSWKKLYANVKQLPVEGFSINTLPPSLFPTQRGYGELYDLMQFLRQRGDEPDPVIIDADDLQRDPASVLLQYCQVVGIPYTDKLLRWEAGTEVLQRWIGSKADLIGLSKPVGYGNTTIMSTEFMPPGAIPSRDQLSQDILQCVDLVMPIYKKMYEMRIRP